MSSIQRATSSERLAGSAQTIGVKRTADGSPTLEARSLSLPIPSITNPPLLSGVAPTTLQRPTQAIAYGTHLAATGAVQDVRTGLDEAAAERARFNEGTVPMQIARKAKEEGKEVCIWFWSSMEPLTEGHCSALVESAKLLGATKVIFVPNFVSPFKVTRPIRLNIADKEAMVRKVVAEMAKKHPNITWELLEAEIKKGGASFTIDTLRDLTEMGVLNKHPSADLEKAPEGGKQDPRSLFDGKNPKKDFCHLAIFGADILNQLHTWREGGSIPDYIETFFVARPGYDLGFDEKVPTGVRAKLENRAVLIPEVNVSSSAVFQIVAEGGSIIGKKLVPECIEIDVQRSLEEGIKWVAGQEKIGASTTLLSSKGDEKKAN